VEGGAPRVAHDLDAVGLGGHRLLELVDHGLRRPGGELLLELDAERGLSEKGLADTLEAAGLTVDRLEITQEANSDSSLAVPILAAYVQAHPNLKAIGTQHGGITGILAEVLQKAGKQPGDITVGGIDLGPATIDGLKSGYVSATLDQLLYLQGFMPVVQCVMSAKYKMPGLSLNTGAGVVTPETIDGLVELIDAGIR